MKLTLITAGIGLLAFVGVSFSASGGRDTAPLRQARDPRVAAVAALPGGVPLDHPIAAIAAGDRRFAAGLALFDKDFHRTEGLGAPMMNADSCRACHQDPVIGGAGGLELNVSRMGHDAGGTIPFEDVDGGQMLSKLYPPFVPGREEYVQGFVTVFEQRQTPTLLGAGGIDRIPEEIIRAGEDPNDADGDGIFGVARMRLIDGQLEVGRFGWKAQVPRLRDFVRDAMGGELGITTSDDNRGFAMLSDADPVLDPELTDLDVNLLHHFMSKLPPPQRGGSDDPALPEGEALFASIGCAKCHTPSLATTLGPVPLYSNLLLHDVMPEDFRGMAEEGADVGFYRTPPLWGLRDTAPYMHDGRASTIPAAILAHESEADGVRQNYEALSEAQKDALLVFLLDL